MNSETISKYFPSKSSFLAVFVAVILALSYSPIALAKTPSSGNVNVTNCDAATFASDVLTYSTVTFQVSCGDLQLLGPITIGSGISVTILGNGYNVVLDGYNYIRAFIIDGGSLTLEGLTLEHFAILGGAGGPVASGSYGQNGAQGTNGVGGGAGAAGSPGTNGGQGENEANAAVGAPGKRMRKVVQSSCLPAASVPTTLSSKVIMPLAVPAEMGATVDMVAPEATAVLEAAAVAQLQAAVEMVEPEEQAETVGRGVMAETVELAELGGLLMVVQSTLLGEP